MALYLKQDFSPPVLSRKWIAMKFRPNMLLQSRHHIISILESGLLFREDCTEVEQEAPSPEEVWAAAGGSWGGWLTAGEGVMSLMGIGACVYMFPPKSLSRTALINIATYTSIPVFVRIFHRGISRGPLASVLANMKEYLWLARCAAACLKEYAALCTDIESLTPILEATHTMLCRQQSDMSLLMSRASSALLGNVPWIRDDIAWDAVRRDRTDHLMKIHHAFMVVQSTFLKHVAMAHFIPPSTLKHKYKNHNERIYWIHNVLLTEINDAFKNNLESLHRNYRMLKNSSNRDSSVKKTNPPINNAWLFSEIHAGVARSALELKLALDKSTKLDIFLDSCAINNVNLDIDVLDKDIDSLIEIITKSLSSIQNSQLRLHKMRSKNKPIEKKSSLTDVTEIAPIEDDDPEPETKDEVFYFVKTEDEPCIQPAADLTTTPGKKEKETTKIVLNELKRKLGKREDVMRERERQALSKTMPELKDLPEFPRQIQFDEFIDKKGFISKIKVTKHQKLLKNYKIKKLKRKLRKYRPKTSHYDKESEINGPIYEANSLLNVKSKLITLSSYSKNIYITKWIKQPKTDRLTDKQLNGHCSKDFLVDQSNLSDSSGLSDVESKIKKSLNQARNSEFKCSKRDLELSESSDSDFEYYSKQRQLLNDVRRHRVARKKNFPAHRLKSLNSSIDNADESLKPIEYSLGTGLAMASVLQVNNANFLNIEREEVFIGDGEVSLDSGNDEDA